MTRRMNQISAFCVSMLMMLTLMVYMKPVEAAAATSEFDFSAEDSLDKYDEYEKHEIENEDGEKITYAKAPLFNSVNTANPLPVNSYRYGAFLRYAGETQRYMFDNFDRHSTNSSIWKNTLTVYADPEVKFTVTDSNGVSAVTELGIQKSSLVKYFNKSTEGNHQVYFIELQPAPSVSEDDYMITFRTESETVQPHYSFWFGAPLTRTAAVRADLFDVSVKYPGRSSASVSVTAPRSIPQRAWVKNVTVEKLVTSGDSYVTRAYLQATFPGASRPATSSQLTSWDRLEFSDLPSDAISKDARGTYKFQMTSVSWGSGIRNNPTYTFTGRMNIEYIYAFGA